MRLLFTLGMGVGGGTTKGKKIREKREEEEKRRKSFGAVGHKVNRRGKATKHERNNTTITTVNYVHIFVKGGGGVQWERGVHCEIFEF